MSIRSFGTPRYEEERLLKLLPHIEGAGLHVKVVRRDKNERPSALRDADHLEVLAYYTWMGPGQLPALEEALRNVDGVYMTTQVRPDPDYEFARANRNVFVNPDWPETLGVRRRGAHSLRPMVIALMRDDPPAAGAAAGGFADG